MSRNEPFFSVVIPAFNAARWLGQTLDSWVQQTARDFEVIVVDDGSEDTTIAVAEAFQGHLNLQIIREQRSGAPAHPCNVGIKAARGELIVHCDSDDMATPDRLDWIRHAWDNAGRRDCLIISDFAEVDADGIVVRNSVLADYSALQRANIKPLGDAVVLLQSDVAFDALLEGSFIRPCSAATPKKVLKQIGGFNETLRNGQDYDLYVRIAREYPLVWSQRILGLYRLTPGSISSRSVIDLTPSKIAIFHRLLDCPLTRAQTKTVRRWIAANFDALGYEYGNQGQVRQSLHAYWKAFMQRPTWAHLRGAAASIAKVSLKWLSQSIRQGR